MRLGKSQLVRWFLLRFDDLSLVVQSFEMAAALVARFELLWNYAWRDRHLWRWTNERIAADAVLVADA